MENTDFIVRLAAAFFLGCALGLERQWRQPMAGLHANTLVATGAALFVTFSILMGDDASPTRVAAQIVSGIGFLGGGVILREGLSISGLNTAATIWCAAAIGCFCGAGFIFQAFIGTLVVLLSNTILAPIDFQLARFARKSRTSSELKLCYQCSFVCQARDEALLRVLLIQALSNSDMKLQSLRSENLELDLVEVQAETIAQTRNDRLLEQIISRLSLDLGVKAASWRIIEQQFP
jgi:putative Mg2+ transporter-C (MgtC) family protein